MRIPSKYVLIGLSVLIMLSIVIYHSDDDNIPYDYSGIVYDINESKSGYTFNFDTKDESFRCYYPERPADLGYYRIRGEFSDDGNIFFIDRMLDLDHRSNG